MKIKQEIYCYPYALGDNDYIKSHIRVWESVGISTKPVNNKLLGVLPLLKGGRKECIVLNWFEDRINYSRFPRLELFRTLLMLLIFKVSFKKVIWIKHNFSGHDNDRKWLRSAIEFTMHRVCDLNLAHREITGFHYIPHPVYTVDTKLVSERDIPFIFFGTIKPYKGLEELLEKWPIDQPLLIAGKSNSDLLTQKIQQIISSRSLKVNWKNYFLSSEELESLLSRSKCLVVPHKESSMVVSGTPFYAMGFGVNVLVRHGEFGQYLAEHFEGVAQFDLKKIELAVSSLKIVSPKKIVSQLLNKCGDKKLAKYWLRHLTN